MKKRWITYIALLILSIIMIFTKGFSGNIWLWTRNEISKGIIDGYTGVAYLSLINCLIMLIIWIINFVITISKNNKIKYKWICFFIVLAVSLLIPIGNMYFSGGIAGRLGEKSIYLWNLIIYNFIK